MRSSNRIKVFPQYGIPLLAADDIGSHLLKYLR